MVATVVILVRHRRAASAAARRVLDPVLITGDGHARSSSVSASRSSRSRRRRARSRTSSASSRSSRCRSSSSRACSGSGSRVPPRASCCRRSRRRRRLEEAQDGLRRALHDPTARAGVVGARERRVRRPGRAPVHPADGARPRDDARRAARGSPSPSSSTTRAARGARAAERRARGRAARARQGPAPGRAPRAGRRAASASATSSRRRERVADVLLRDRPRRTDRPLQRHPDRARAELPTTRRSAGGRSGRCSSSPEDAEGARAAIVSARAGRARAPLARRRRRAIVVAWSLTRLTDAQGASA